MIRIYESNDKELLNKDDLSNIMLNRGFKRVTSNDEMVLNFTKVESKLYNLPITITTYYEDVTNKFSLGVTSPDVPDYTYLSDYMSTVPELTNWFNVDYSVVLNEIRKMIK